jgi:vacuolar-type H+-ATPase catalytic subunit A/Vma1
MIWHSCILVDERKTYVSIYELACVSRKKLAGEIISLENDATIIHTDEEITGLVICRSIKNTCKFLPFSSEWFGRLQAEFTCDYVQ